jgi:hypothetical protein
VQVAPGHPDGGKAQGTPSQAGFSPQYDPGEVFEIAKRLMRNM